MKMNRLFDVGRLRRWSATTLIAVLALSLCATDVLALEFEFGKDVNVSMDTTLSYTSSWRTEDPDDDFAVFNPADPLVYSQGDANFDDKGDQFLSTFRALVDLDVNYKDDYGVFMRANAFYDTVYYRRENKFSSTVNPAAGEWFTNDYDEFEDAHGAAFELLDAFVYGNFSLGNAPMTLRVGRQAVFWGESLAVFGGVATAMSPLDLTLANNPGAETKEVILPTGQGYASITTPNDKLTLASYVKWEWDKSVFDEAGSFFSTNNALDDSVQSLVGITRLADEGEDDGDEYGVALRYLFDNGDELGLYYLNYRETLPLLKAGLKGFNAAGAPMIGYWLEYEDNVEMYAASFSSVFDATGTNYAVEVSYRPEVLLRMDKATPTALAIYETSELLQVQANLIHVVGDIPGADSATITAEWAYNTVLDHDKDDLYEDKWAHGGKVKFALDYFDVMTGLDINVPITIGWNPKGRTSYALSGLTEDANSLTVGLQGTYLGVYKAGLTYVNFMGGTDDNNKTDRDYVSLSLKYTF